VKNLIMTAFDTHVSTRTYVLVVMCLSLVPLAACAQAPTAAPTPGPGLTRTRAADGAEIAYVCEGEFLMGSTDSDPKAGIDEKPAHPIYLEAFWIDRAEVTNAQYAEFLNALGGHTGTCGGHDCAETKVDDKYSHILRRSQEGRYIVEGGFEDHPVTQVTWYGAQAYCEWVGARLPTEAEWEKAARGDDGRLYPWGNDAPDCHRAQYGDCGGATVSVGSKLAGASPYGVVDMAGNVWEWVADWYDAAYYASSPTSSPRGPSSGERKVFRGGSWGYPAAFIRAADRARNRPSYAGFNIGFRCATTMPPR
jgi:eukaryotic-like serine/threonine-protein kinase